MQSPVRNLKECYSAIVAALSAAAEANDGGAPGLGFAHASADVLRRFHVEVKRELLVQLGRVGARFDPRPLAVLRLGPTCCSRRSPTAPRG